MGAVQGNVCGTAAGCAEVGGVRTAGDLVKGVGGRVVLERDGAAERMAEAKRGALGRGGTVEGREKWGRTAEVEVLEDGRTGPIRAEAIDCGGCCDLGVGFEAGRENEETDGLPVLGSEDGGGYEGGGGGASWTAADWRDLD